jgi:ubiquinone/menaquinone biosynthesis C-methylase UbiE
MNKYFYEVFENIPRQGPGMNSYTRKAYNSIKQHLSEKPAILDIGCGKGVQTLELARISSGRISALDIRPFFLACLSEEAAKSGFADRITCIEADMKNMPIENSSFDLIWAEGSVFVIGIKEGLKNWKNYLKHKGFLVLTDLVWHTESRPDDLNAYFEEECLYMLTTNEVIAEAEKNGYRCVDHFTLPDEGWTNEYFLPQQKQIIRLREKYKNSKEAIETFEALEYEREIITRSFNYVGYEFFILQSD